MDKLSFIIIWYYIIIHGMVQGVWCHFEGEDDEHIFQLVPPSHQKPHS